MVIDWFCTNIAIEEVDTRSVAETVEVKRLVVKVVMVHEVDGQIAGIAGINDGFNWVDGVAKVDDELDQVDRIAGIADRVDIYKVIGFL